MSDIPTPADLLLQTKLANKEKEEAERLRIECYLARVIEAFPTLSAEATAKGEDHCYIRYPQYDWACRNAIAHHFENLGFGCRVNFYGEDETSDPIIRINWTYGNRAKTKKHRWFG